ncbi:Fe(3+) ABC transporter substrate-binding protein [Teredinibacter purpureus]|jgi:ABC-type Fe3+ transport system, periplasmic component|uniref:Fe(3+) ABC transporter substrate-binding protein n=1 Tax=Teredinibacter purpureus TaxID=2731756 RepID=UPI0005F85043|nr:Fe(3+) ABC transporter substrate-binding protein [Teredinibacter purpureus]
MYKQIIGFLTLLSLAALPQWSIAKEVNVYSARKEALILPLLDQFSEKTGIKVNLITGKADALIVRMANEGKFSPADILLTTDVGRLVRAKSQGLTQAYASPSAAKNIPLHLQDSEGHWVGLTLRARPFMVAPDRVNATKLTSLEDLASPQWKGKLCVRSSGNIYNQSMVAALIQQLGEEKTMSIIQGLVANFARPPMGGDRDQIKAVAAGQCDVAIANTYYLAGMLSGSDPSETAAASKVAVVWPNQQDRGAHVNISGAAIARYAKNTVEAQTLIDFMMSKEAQAWYAETNFEYPVRKDVHKSGVLTSFGDFKSEKIPLEKVGELNATALKLMDKAGWK